MLGASALATLVAVGAAWAGSTGTTQLFKPQGGGSGTSIGDFISNSNTAGGTPGGTGLDTFYRYFIEVPPNQTRLRVQIFDADIGVDCADGASEDEAGTGGRDRCRGVPCDCTDYDTSATYSLLDPSGASQTVNFTTGDIDEPANSNNAWLTFYDSQQAPSYVDSTIGTTTGVTVSFVASTSATQSASTTAPTYVDSTIAESLTGDLTISVPAGVQTGDLLLAFVGTDRDTSTTNVTANQTGWTSVTTSNCGDGTDGDTEADCRIAIFRRFVAGGDPASYSFDFGDTGDESIGSIVAYRGVDPTTPIDDFDLTVATTEDPVAPASTTTVANTRVVRFAFAQDNEPFDARPATNIEEGITNDGDSNDDIALSVSHATQAGTGSTGTANFSTDPTTNDPRTIAGTMVVRPAPATTLTLAVPGGAATGDLLLAIMGVDRDGTTTTGFTASETGWTSVTTATCPDGGDASADADCRVAVFRRFVAGGDPSSYSFTYGTADAAAGVILAYRGVDTTTPLDVAIGTTSATTDTPTAPAVTTVTNNAMVVRFALAQSNNAFTASPATNRQAVSVDTASGNEQGLALSASDAVQAVAGGSGTAAFTGASAPDPRSLAGTVALRPAAASTTLTIAAPAGTATGDLLLAILGVDRDGTTTTGFTASDAGWTSVTTATCPDGGDGSGDADCRVAVFRRFVAGGDPSSYSFTYGTADAAIGTLVAYRGVDPTTPLDVAIGTTSATTDNPTAPSVTTVTANTRVVRFSIDQAGVAFTASPATNREAGSVDTTAGGEQGIALSLSDASQTATGATGTAAFTAVAAPDGRALSGTIALRPGGTVLAGHWEFRVDQSTSAGNDLNGFGVRADDGDATTGGTEYLIYYDSHTAIGVHPDQSVSEGLTFDLYPYVTRGCSLYVHDFDFDRGNGTGNGPGGIYGEAAFTSRTGAFNQTSGGADRSQNDAWSSGQISGWRDTDDGGDYGIWSMDYSIYTYNTPGINGNYGDVWFSDDTVTSPIPLANPTDGAFRVYLSTDAINSGASTAPAKPYLEQFVRCAEATCAAAPTEFVVTVRLVNPTGSGGSITLDGSTIGSRTRQVSGTIPATNVTYQGLEGTPTGTTSFPSIGGTGAWTWRPGTVAAGTTALLAYRIQVPSNVSTTVTGLTGMTVLDHTQNTSQERATFDFGALCNVQVRGANTTPVTVVGFRVERTAGGAMVEWTTDAELGAIAYDVMRYEPERSRFRLVASVPALVESPQGTTYRVLDGEAPSSGNGRYVLVERANDGTRHRHGPYRVRFDEHGPRAEAFDAPELLPSGVLYERRARVRNAALAAVPAASRSASDAVRASEAAPFGDQTRLRVGVSSTGLVRVPLTEIASAFGLTMEETLARAQKDRFSVWRQSEQIVSMLADDQTALLFFGEHEFGIYSNETFYFVLSKKNGGKPSSVPGGSPAPDAAEQVFSSTAKAEKDVFFGTAAVYDLRHDYWFWANLATPGGTFAFDLQAPDLRAGSGLLELTLHGSSTAIHEAEVRVNGNSIGTFSFEGLVPSTSALPVPAEYLVEGANAVEIRLLQGSFFFNRARLTHSRARRASEDRLLLPEGTSGAVTVDGLSGTPQAVLELGPRGKFKKVIGVTVTPGPTTKASFHATGKAYLVVGPAGFVTPTSLTVRGPQKRPAEYKQVDYLVIAPASLAAGAEALAAYRRSQGLTAAVVPVEDILDAYADGANDPRALRAYFEAVWKKPEKKARYVLLVGGGTLDYRNLFGQNDNLVPAMVAATTHGLFASDAILGDLSTPEDGTPEVMVGRLPALTEQEVFDYLAKVQAYESGAAGGTALFLADNNETGFPFVDDQSLVAGGFQPGFNVQRVDLAGPDAGSVAVARSGLFSGWQPGRGFVSYLGHGGTSTLSADGLFAASDVASLPSGAHPLILAWTCLINRFEIPGYSSLGEDLVRRAGSGAVASWAPAGQSIHQEAVAFGRMFGQAAQSGGRFGDAWKTAALAYRKAGGLVEMLRMYTLLGDPAIRLPAAQTPTPGPGIPGE